MEFNQELFSLLIRNVPAPVAIFDTEMRYIFTSDRWLKDYNLGSQNIIGLSHYEVFPNLSEEWKAIHRRCLGGECVYNDDDSFVRPNGRREYLRWDIVPWRDTQGSIGGIIIFSEVVTKLRELELELKERVSQLELENKSMIGREIRIAELKKEIETLRGQAEAKIP